VDIEVLGPGVVGGRAGTRVFSASPPAYTLSIGRVAEALVIREAETLRRNSTPRRHPAFALLAALVFAAPVCVPDPDPVAAPDPVGDPPDTVLLQSCDSDAEPTFCWEGADPDGQVVGHQHLLIRVDEEYYETAGASGGWLDADESEADDLWTPRDDRTSITYGLEPGSYLFRVRAVDDEGNPDPTPAETLWQRDPYPPVVVIESGCGALYPTPPLVMTCDAADVGTGRRPTPRTDLLYRYEFYDEFWWAGCPVFAPALSEWTSFPDDGRPVRIVFEDTGQLTPRTAEGGDIPCMWYFSFAVRDPAGNIGSTACTIQWLR
jgi:hypothetical protein